MTIVRLLAACTGLIGVNVLVYRSLFEQKSLSTDDGPRAVGILPISSQQSELPPYPADHDPSLPPPSTTVPLFTLMSNVPRDDDDVQLPDHGRAVMLLVAAGAGEPLPPLRIDPMYTFGKTDIVSSHILANNAWDLGLQQNVRRVLRKWSTSASAGASAGPRGAPGVVFLDLGMNIGAYTLVAAAEGYDVWCFEMMKKAWYKASATAQEGGFGEKVRLFNFAMSDVAGEVVQISTPDEGNFGVTVAKEAGAGFVKEPEEENAADPSSSGGGAQKPRAQVQLSYMRSFHTVYFS